MNVSECIIILISGGVANLTLLQLKKNLFLLTVIKKKINQEGHHSH